MSMSVHGDGGRDRRGGDFNFGGRKRNQRFNTSAGAFSDDEDAASEYYEQDRFERMSYSGHVSHSGHDFEHDMGRDGYPERHSMSFHGGIHGSGGGTGIRGGGSRAGMDLLESNLSPVQLADLSSGSADSDIGRSEIAQHNVVSKLVHAERNGDARTRALCIEYLCVRASEDDFLTALTIARDDNVYSRAFGSGHSGDMKTEALRQEIYLKRSHAKRTKAGGSASSASSAVAMAHASPIDDASPLGTAAAASEGGVIRDDVSETGSTAMSIVSDGTFRLVVDGDTKHASIVASESGGDVAPGDTSASAPPSRNVDALGNPLFQPQAGSGDTYLHVAAACCGVDDCKRLIESSTMANPVDINATNNEGRTSLHLAALRNKLDVVQLLLYVPFRLSFLCSVLPSSPSFLRMSSFSLPLFLPSFIPSIRRVPSFLHTLHPSFDILFPSSLPSFLPSKVLRRRREHSGSFLPSFLPSFQGTTTPS